MPTESACEKIVVKNVYSVVPVTPTDESTAVVVASSVGMALFFVGNQLSHRLSRRKFREFVAIARTRRPDAERDSKL